MKYFRYITMVLVASALARADPLAVHVSVVRGSPTTRAWTVRGEVRNESTEPQEIAYMLCSWSPSWRIEAESYIEIWSWDCRKNFPTGTHLKPGEVLQFQFPVVSRTPVPASGVAARFGFQRRFLREPGPSGEARFTDTSEWYSAPAVNLPAPVGSSEIQIYGEVSIRPNKSLQPTATPVTPPAAQEIVPAVAVAEH